MKAAFGAGRMVQNPTQVPSARSLPLFFFF